MSLAPCATYYSSEQFEILTAEYIMRNTGLVQIVKNLPAIQETQVQSLGQEDPLQKGLTTHSNILAWRIPMDRRAQ